MSSLTIGASAAPLGFGRLAWRGQAAEHQERCSHVACSSVAGIPL